MKTLTTLKYQLVKATPLFLLAVLGTAALTAPEAAYASAAGNIQDGVDAVNEGGGGDFEEILQNVINILLFLVGAAAVIMLIVGGFRYVTSNGDSSAITSAKNTILYSIVGIVVALAAFAIVNFVLEQF